MRRNVKVGRGRGSANLWIEILTDSLREKKKGAKEASNTQKWRKRNYSG